MKIFKLIFKIALAFLTFGALASLYLSKNKELLVLMEDGETAYRFSKETPVWEKTEREYSWKVWNESVSGEKADEIITDWKKEHMVNAERLNIAIEFAADKHSGQFRKATQYHIFFIRLRWYRYFIPCVQI